LIRRISRDDGFRDADQALAMARTSLLGAVDHGKTFGFLVDPIQGSLREYVVAESSDPAASPAVMLEVLGFLSDLFALPGLPFLGSEIYVNTFISFHFVAFVKNYIMPTVAQENMRLCTSHLAILLSFAQNKNELVLRKFFELGVMAFLAGEIGLEYSLLHGGGASCSEVDRRLLTFPFVSCVSPTCCVRSNRN